MGDRYIILGHGSVDALFIEEMPDVEVITLNDYLKESIKHVADKKMWQSIEEIKIEAYEKVETSLWCRSGWEKSNRLTDKRGNGSRQQPGHACRGPTILDSITVFKLVKKQVFSIKEAGVSTSANFFKLTYCHPYKIIYYAIVL